MTSLVFLLGYSFRGFLFRVKGLRLAGMAKVMVACINRCFKVAQQGKYERLDTSLF